MSWELQISLQIGELDLELEMRSEGGALALVGPNGSGKTTLLRTIAGAYRPSAGFIQLDGLHVFDSQNNVDLPPERRSVGYVPQGFGLFPHLSVLDNIGFGWLSRRSRGSREARHNAARALLEEMNCAHLGDRWPTSLSGGEKQRVALARALMIEPQVLLLDEPFAALDISARRKLRAFLAAELQSRGIPAIVVTHDIRDVIALGAEVVALNAGRIVQQGSVEEITRQPANEFVAEFFQVQVDSADN